MASSVQNQQPYILNLENKIRQQSKIAHEVGAGSQCLRCGPKCQGFDLHFWRKVCRNCRCGKENHSILEEDYSESRVGRLFDDEGNAADNGNRDKSLENVAAKLKSMAPSQPQVALVGDAGTRNRALDRQLPEHDLDPNKCQSLSDPDKQKMQEYVNNVKQFAVGRGLVQKCPAPPPQLDRILEQKLTLINTNNNIQNLSNSPKVSPKPPPKLFNVPKPYVPANLDAPKPFTPFNQEAVKPTTAASQGAARTPVPSFTEQIKREASKPAATASVEPPEEFPPPPPEFLEPFREEPQDKFKDPVQELFDFIEDVEGKRHSKRSSSHSKPSFQAPSSQPKTPNPTSFNSAPKPYGSPRPEQKHPAEAPKIPGISTAPKALDNAPAAPKAAPLTTDFDYVPDNGNIQPDQQLEALPQQQQREVAVEAEKVWFCFKCMEPIQANQVAIFAERAGGDKCWHPECFTCTICSETLADLIYFFAEGNIYCGRHYAEQMNIPRCKACDELIFATEYTNAEGANWHTNHFCCWICDTPLVGKQYTPIEGQPHCLDCYQKKYGKDCHQCGHPIRANEARVSHGELYWHASEQCFRCDGCRNSLLNRQFLLKDQSTFCSRNCATNAKAK